MKKLLICLTVLFSVFLFTNSVSAETFVSDAKHTYDTDVIYSTLKNNGIDVSNYKYILINDYFSSSEKILIYLFNDIFTWVDVDARTGGVSKSLRSAPKGISYTVIQYKYNNTIVKSGSYTSNGTNSSSVASWYANNGYFSVELGNSYLSIWANYDTGITGVKGKVNNNYLTLPVSTFNITFHLNGGVVDDNNWISGDDGSYLVGMKYEDYSVDIEAEQLMEYLINQNVSKETMQFVGWYYDEKLTQKVEATDIIDSDKHFYAKYQYKNVEDFLNNTTFNSYTFDENYNYAVISLNNQQNRDIYLGLDIFATNLEVYKYNKINLSYVQGSTSCLTPIFSKNDKYYYQLSDSLDNDYEVLILEKEKLKGNYNFLLSNNAYVTYTNDLKNVVIKDESGNDITTDIEDSYDYSQDNLLNSENDLLEIFKDLINNKDNNVFSYFNQVWNYMKTNKLFTYFMTLIIGSLIILIIKSASR